jgi:hypothetical protein
MTSRRIGWMFFAAVMGVFRFASAQTDGSQTPAANPGRPTVSTPATLTPVGYVQFETGIVEARDSGDLAAQFSVNEVAKLAVHRRAQLLFQFEAYARSREASGNEQSIGGTVAGLQFVAVDGAGMGPTLSASYFHAISDGSAPDLDIGSAKQSAIVLFSADLRKPRLHIDTNGIFNEQIDDDRSRAQYGQTFCVSRAFSAVTIAAEIWHFTQPFEDADAAGLLLALSFAPRPNLVFDAGFNRGLTDTSTRWEFFAGFTYLLPHALWRQPATSSSSQRGGSSARNRSTNVPISSGELATYSSPERTSSSRR